MKFDDLVPCSRKQSGGCNGSGDACYITEVTADIKNEFCFSCGFQSNTLLRQGEKFLEEQLKTLPSLYKSLMDEEESGKIWMPTFIKIEGKGMVYAEGVSRDKWGWAAVKQIRVPKKEKKKFKNNKYKVDTDSKKFFEHNNFIGALEYLGILPE